MELNKYTQEVVDYLCKKLPDVNVATILEIAEFFVMKSNNYSQDQIKKHDEHWLDQMKRHDDFYSKLYLKLVKEK